MAGFVTVYPSGVTRPVASSINVDGAGQTIANLVTVPIGAGGSVDVYTQMSTDLVADVQGYYRPAAAAQAGRFVPLTPTQVARHPRVEFDPTGRARPQPGHHRERRRPRRVACRR